MVQIGFGTRKTTIQLYAALWLKRYALDGGGSGKIGAFYNPDFIACLRGLKGQLQVGKGILPGLAVIRTCGILVNVVARLRDQGKLPKQGYVEEKIFCHERVILKRNKGSSCGNFPTGRAKNEQYHNKAKIIIFFNSLPGQACSGLAAQSECPFRAQ